MNLNTTWWKRGRILLVLLALLETSSQGSTNVSAGGPRASGGNRFLLIVETSKAMRRQGDAALAAIDELLRSGIQGQLRTGDSLGLWTYNDQLYTGRLPVQEWTPKFAKDVRERIEECLAQHKLEKSPELKKVLPMLAKVVKDSEFLTVILVSSGEQEIAGTPFDRQINECYKTWRDRQRKPIKPSEAITKDGAEPLTLTEQQRKAFRPFVTVLRGERGELTQYSVSPVPWPIEIPALPPERDVLKLAQHKAAPVPAKPVPPPVGKSLILTGSSRKTEAVDTSTPAPVAVPIPQPLTTHESPKDPRLDTAEEILAKLLAESGQPRAMTPPLKVVTSHGSTSNSLPAAATTVGTSNPNAFAAVAADTQKPVLEHPLASSNGIPNPTPQAAPAMTASTTSAVPAKTLETATHAKSDPVMPKAEASVASAASLANTPSPITESEAVLKAAATAAPSESFLAHKGIQRAAMALAVGAIVCLFIAVRRPKPVYQASIITRSLERDSR